MIILGTEIPSTDPHCGALAMRELPDERLLAVYPMSYGKARLVICADADAFEYYDGWCYQCPDVALFALAVWDGDGDPPIGWHRELSTGRRRDLNNPTPETEYVRS